MTDTKQVADVAKNTEQKEVVLRPAVDIFEMENAITVKADLPGVSRENLTVQLDGDKLTIEGQLTIPAIEGIQTVGGDMQSARYVRSFSLSSELESEKINAEMLNGELTLSIPKRAEAKPKKIEVRAV